MPMRQRRSDARTAFLWLVDQCGLRHRMAWADRVCNPSAMERYFPAGSRRLLHPSEAAAGSKKHKSSLASHAGFDSKTHLLQLLPYRHRGLRLARLDQDRDSGVGAEKRRDLRKRRNQALTRDHPNDMLLPRYTACRGRRDPAKSESPKR